MMMNSGRSRRASLILTVLAVLTIVLLPALALAGPRSGGSFGGRLGFRSGSGFSAPRSYSTPGYSGGGSHFIFAPGWGWGGYGMGGGLGLFGTVLVVAVLGYAAVAVARAVRRARQGGAGAGDPMSWGQGYDDEAVASGRAYVYRLQVALGRSGRGVQQ